MRGNAAELEKAELSVREICMEPQFRATYALCFSAAQVSSNSSVIQDVQIRCCGRGMPRTNSFFGTWRTIDDAMGEVLVVNDSWGALSTALGHRRLSTLSDSYVAHAAARENCRRNHIDLAGVRFLTSFDPLPARIDLLVMKVPKSLALLEDQLHRIAPHLHDKTRVLAAAMTKHIHVSTLDLFAKIVGPTRTSLAEKKARCIFCEPDPNLQRPPNPWPKTHTVTPGHEVVTNHAGVFAAERLDGGTRLLLENLPHRDGPQRIVDLGCGNGILGVRAAIGSPKSEITFVDESYRAVASAQATFRANLGPERKAHFIVGNGLFDLANGSTGYRRF